MIVVEIYISYALSIIMKITFIRFWLFFMYYDALFYFSRNKEQPTLDGEICFTYYSNELSLLVVFIKIGDKSSYFIFMEYKMYTYIPAHIMISSGDAVADMRYRNMVDQKKKN